MHQKPAKIAFRARSAFTLLELLIVMSIGAIVVMMAMPNFNYVEMRLDGSSRQVDMALLAAQRLAVLRQYSIVVAFDTTTQMVRLHEDRNNNGQVDSGENVNFVKLEEGVKFGRGAAPAVPTIGNSGISFVKRQDAMPSVTFTREGAAGEAGGLYIASERALRNGAYAKETRAFEVNRGTGRTLMYAYTGSGWRRSF